MKKQKNKIVKIFVSVAIAMAILFITINKIEDNRTYWAIKSEENIYDIAEDIARLKVRSHTEADISLHSQNTWEEPEEGNCWLEKKNYCVSLPLPSEFMEDGHKIVVNVDYPDRISAGETGIITITAKDEEGAVCTGEYLITPAADLHLAHGEYLDCHGGIIGDAIDINSFLGAIVIDFCTYPYVNPDDFSARTGACPTTVVVFNSPLNLDSDL